MSKKYVERLPHSCGTKGGLQVIQEPDGRYTGFCFKCHTYVKDPYGDRLEEGYVPPRPKTKSPQEVAKELAAIAGYPQEAMPDEKITQEAVRHYGVRQGFDQETASVITSHYYPYELEGELKAFQVKVLEGKRFFSVGDFDECEPFGWSQALKAGGKRLYITEGQKDCLTLWQVLRKHSNIPNYNPAVISLPNGVKSVDKMAKFSRQMDNWAEVVLCFDNDDAGKDAVKRFLKLYPTAKVVNLPLKDAHDMLMAGREKELHQAAMFQAKTQLSDKLKRSSDVWDLAMQRPEMGLAWPYPSLTELTRGIRRGEGYYFGAGVCKSIIQP